MWKIKTTVIIVCPVIKKESNTVADPGCLYWIPDPKFAFRIPDPGSKRYRILIHIKEYKYFERKMLFLCSRKYDPGYSSRIRILIFYPSRITRGQTPDPGSGTLEGKITEHPP